MRLGFLIDFLILAVLAYNFYYNFKKGLMRILTDKIADIGAFVVSIFVVPTLSCLALQFIQAKTLDTGGLDYTKVGFSALLTYIKVDYMQTLFVTLVLFLIVRWVVALTLSNVLKIFNVLNKIKLFGFANSLLGGIVGSIVSSLGIFFMIAVVHLLTYITLTGTLATAIGVYKTSLTYSLLEMLVSKVI